MAKTRSMTGNKNHDHDASSSSSSCSRKRFKTVDKGDVAPWSDVDHDVLFQVMMQLGFIDFFAFSGVCKSWRSFALPNRNMFMASKPPMSVCMCIKANESDCCYLEDFERKKLKSIIPHYARRICVGSTCGYLVLFGKETCDFWLVNPITRHELHFPDFLLYLGAGIDRIRTILVFSHSISGWMFVVFSGIISYYIAGKQGWNHVSSTIPIIDVHVFKGKIYTLHADCSLGELRLDPNRKRKWKLMLLKTKNFLKPDLLKPELVSSAENLYLVDRISQPEKVMELDFGEMKWVSPEKTIGEYAFFISMFSPSAAIKPESWAGIQTQYKSYGHFLETGKSRQRVFSYKWVWYFPHDGLNVNLLLE